MKFTKMISAVLAAGIGMAALPAFAENRLSLGYQDVSIDGLGSLDGVGFRQFSRGKNFESNWDGFLADTDFGTLFLSDADLSWKWRGIVGPKVKVVSASIDRVGDSATYAGVTFGRQVGELRLGADVLSDVENFGDNNLYAARAEYAATPKLTLLGEVGYSDLADATYGQVEAIYDLNSRFYVHGEYTSASVQGLADGDTAFVGLGLRF